MLVPAAVPVPGVHHLVPAPAAPTVLGIAVHPAVVVRQVVLPHVAVPVQVTVAVVARDVLLPVRVVEAPVAKLVVGALDV